MRRRRRVVTTRTVPSAPATAATPTIIPVESDEPVNASAPDAALETLIAAVATHVPSESREMRFADPFSDGPLRYTRLGDGFVVYTVGEDGDLEWRDELPESGIGTYEKIFFYCAK